MTDFLGKKYQMQSTENFEAYLEVMGVSEEFRKIISALIVTVQLLEEGGTFIFKTFSDAVNVEMSFRSRVEFEEPTQDGSQIMSTITVDKNKMIQVQKYPHIITTIERTFSDTELIAVLTAGDVVCTSKFKLVE